MKDGPVPGVAVSAQITMGPSFRWDDAGLWDCTAAVSQFVERMATRSAANVEPQIAPRLVVGLNQRNFPNAFPRLDLLFSCNRRGHHVVVFKVDQSRHATAPSEAIDQVFAVLSRAATRIAETSALAIHA